MARLATFPHVPATARNCTFSMTTFSLLRFWPLCLSSHESNSAALDEGRAAS